MPRLLVVLWRKCSDCEAFHVKLYIAPSLGCGELQLDEYLHLYADHDLAVCCLTRTTHGSIDLVVNLRMPMIRIVVIARNIEIGR